VLSILSIDNDDNDVYDPVAVVCIETPHLTWARGTKNHVRIDNFELSKICHENSRCCYECDDNCNGKDNCNNKRIQRNQWKNVVKRDSGNKKKGFGLFLEEGCRKDDFIIEYTGKVTKTIGRKYSMKIKPPESIRKEKTVYIDAKIDGGLAKYINHSCNPNCKPFQWYVEGLPSMCFFAKRDIEKGAELTFDYQWANVMGKKSTKCLCGEENCRGYIEK
jgi:SET domain-containing protein